MELIEMIRNARKQANLTQQQLSDTYKIPVRTLVDWERGVRTPPEYVVDLLLRCMTIDFPTVESALSEQEQPTKQEPTYTFTDEYGKSLTPELEKIIRAEYEAGRVDPQQEQEQDFYGELTAKTNRKRGKLYLCTKPDPDRGLDYGTEFRVIKEV